MKENLFIFYLLSFTWGILWTLIGFIALLFVLPFSKGRIEYSLYRGRIVAHFKNADFGGASLGIVLFVSTKREWLLDHEIGHTIQNIMYGPLFPFIVAIPSGIRYQMFSYLEQRHYNKYGTYLGYDDIWFEGQATKLGSKYKTR